MRKITNILFSVINNAEVKDLKEALELYRELKENSREPFEYYETCKRIKILEAVLEQLKIYEEEKKYLEEN